MPSLAVNFSGKMFAQMMILVSLSIVIYACYFFASDVHRDLAVMREKIDTLTQTQKLELEKMRIAIEELSVQNKANEPPQTGAKNPTPPKDNTPPPNKPLKGWSKCLRFDYRKNCNESDLDDDDPSLPPCKLTIMKYLAHSLTTALEEAQTQYFISYGTLLGAARNHSILPWTSDVDLIVNPTSFLKMADIVSKATENGLYFFEDPKGLGRVCFTESSTYLAKWKKEETKKETYYNAYPYGDVYQLREGSTYSVKYGPSCKFKEETIYPLKQIQLYDDLVWAPNDHQQFLKQLYGPDWMKPPPPSLRTGHGSYKKACNSAWQN